ncbi:hypothetical protein L6232_22670, partial [Shewanella sp. C31]|nr:hypothetical protein [Shewanella electrica]
KQHQCIDDAQSMSESIDNNRKKKKLKISNIIFKGTKNVLSITIRQPSALRQNTVIRSRVEPHCHSQWLCAKPSSALT